MLERLEDSLQALRVEARAAVGDRHEHVVARAAHDELDRIGGRREPERVLEHVYEHALQLRRVDAHERRFAVERDLDACRVGAECLERARDQLVHRPQLAVRRRDTGLEPRKVEQVRHQPLEPRRLEADRLQERGTVVGVERERAALEPAGSDANRRQR